MMDQQENADKRTSEPCERSRSLPAGSESRSTTPLVEVKVAKKVWTTVTTNNGRVVPKAVGDVGQDHSRRLSLPYNNIVNHIDVMVPRGLPKEQRSADGSIHIWERAYGNRLGGNRTAFADYHQLRSYIENVFGGPKGHVHRLHAAFDKYCSKYPHVEDGKKKKPDSPKKPDPTSCDDTTCKLDNIDWSSSKFVDYLFFLFEYFVPHAAYGSKGSAAAEAFNMQVGRDTTIELLLSICTGVVLARKSVASHMQQVLKLLKKDFPEHVDTMKYGFEREFIGDDNPMDEEIKWLHQYHTGKTDKKRKRQEVDSTSACPLLLPPILAFFLEPIDSVLNIDFRRMNDVFIFADWTLPQGLLLVWEQLKEEFKQREKLNTAERKVRKLEKERLEEEEAARAREEAATEEATTQESPTEAATTEEEATEEATKDKKKRKGKGKGKQCLENPTPVQLPAIRPRVALPSIRLRVTLPSTIPGGQPPSIRPGAQLPSIRPGVQLPSIRPGVQLPSIRLGVQLPSIRPGVQLVQIPRLTYSDESLYDNEDSNSSDEHSEESDNSDDSDDSEESEESEESEDSDDSENTEDCEDSEDEEASRAANLLLFVCHNAAARYRQAPQEPEEEGQAGPGPSTINNAYAAINGRK